MHRNRIPAGLVAPNYVPGDEFNVPYPGLHNNADADIESNEPEQLEDDGTWYEEEEVIEEPSESGEETVGGGGAGGGGGFGGGSGGAEVYAPIVPLGGITVPVLSVPSTPTTTIENKPSIVIGGTVSMPTGSPGSGGTALGGLSSFVPKPKPSAPIATQPIAPGGSLTVKPKTPTPVTPKLPTTQIQPVKTVAAPVKAPAKAPVKAPQARPAIKAPSKLKGADGWDNYMDGWQS